MIDEGRDMYPKLQRLLKLAPERRIPIVHSVSTDMRNTLLERWAPICDGVSLNSGTSGAQIVDELKPAAWNEYEVYIPKPKYSCFYGTKLDVILANPPFRGRKTMIITGMATNYCCMTTSIDAFNRDYDVIFVDDLNCTFAFDNGIDAATMHRITVETLKQGFISELLSADVLLARPGGSVQSRTAA